MTTNSSSYQTEGPYRVDVTDDGRGWATNALRFATQQEGEEYARDLSSRWFAVKAARVVESTTADREPVDPADPRIVVNYL